MEVPQIKALLKQIVQDMPRHSPKTAGTDGISALRFCSVTAFLEMNMYISVGIADKELKRPLFLFSE